MIMKCYGWIPNLTGNIFLSNPYEKLPSIDRNSKLEFNLNSILDTEFDYVIKFRMENIDDSETQDSAIFLFFFNKGDLLVPKKIAFFVKTDSNNYVRVLDIHKLTFDKFGFFCFETSKMFFKEGSPGAERYLLRQVYYIVMDLFSDYYHANISGVSDLYGSLSPAIFEASPSNNDDINNDDNNSFNRDSTAAIRFIINSYLLKLESYLKLDKKPYNFFSLKEQLEILDQLYHQARIDLVYGIKFIRFYNKKFDNEEIGIYIYSIQNGIKIIELHYEDLKLKYVQESSETLRHLLSESIKTSKLTLGVALLTIILIFLTLALVIQD
jgi:hypothetical protein